MNRKAPKLVPLRKTHIQTMFQPAGTVYAHQIDGFVATYLPGRNVIVVEATTLDGKQTVKKVCQVADFKEAVEKFPGENEPGSMAIFGRGIEGFDAVAKIVGVIVEEIDNR